MYILLLLLLSNYYLLPLANVSAGSVKSFIGFLGSAVVWNLSNNYPYKHTIPSVSRKSIEHASIKSLNPLARKS